MGLATHPLGKDLRLKYHKNNSGQYTQQEYKYFNK